MTKDVGKNRNMLSSHLWNTCLKESNVSQGSFDFQKLLFFP